MDSCRETIKRCAVGSTRRPRQKTAEYPGLSHLAYGIGYLEQLLAILAEPLLIAGFSVAMIDFLSGGGLLSVGVIRNKDAKAGKV